MTAASGCPRRWGCGMWDGDSASPEWVHTAACASCAVWPGRVTPADRPRQARQPARQEQGQQGGGMQKISSATSSRPCCRLPVRRVTPVTTATAGSRSTDGRADAQRTIFNLSTPLETWEWHALWSKVGSYLGSQGGESLWQPHVLGRAGTEAGTLGSTGRNLWRPVFLHVLSTFSATRRRGAE